jgi:cytochrome c5
MSRWAIVAVTLAVVLAIAAGTFYLVVSSGIYNVAASTGETPLVAWTLSTTMEHSVKHHARNVQVPAGFNVRERSAIVSGAKPFSEMCQLCHGGPGVKPAEWMVMSPEPPDLSHAANDWNDAELYWIIKHGIKMAGMPSFGSSHGEKELWELVAFVRNLPEMTAQDYKQLAGEPGMSGSGHDHSH